MTQNEFPLSTLQLGPVGPVNTQIEVQCICTSEVLQCTEVLHCNGTANVPQVRCIWTSVPQIMACVNGLLFYADPLWKFNTPFLEPLWQIHNNGSQTD